MRHHYSTATYGAEAHAGVDMVALWFRAPGRSHHIVVGTRPCGCSYLRDVRRLLRKMVRMTVHPTACRPRLAGDYETRALWWILITEDVSASPVPFLLASFSLWFIQYLGFV